MRSILSCLCIVALSLQVSDVMSFSLRRGVTAFAPLASRRVAVSSSFRWMSAQEPTVEKTEEEKAAIKAAREARK